MRITEPVGPRRRGALIALAVVLVMAGLVLAATAPAGPSTSNKVDAYGGPTPVAPTNPKSKAECDAYYSAANQDAEARGCRATASYNGGLKKCAKKQGARKAACKKAAKSTYAKAKAKVAKQAKAEKACSDAYSEGSQKIDPNAPDSQAQYDALSTAQVACIKKAQNG